ncbi:MAG: hypothetical protein HC810_06155 [Acaryochloridaceae cyanobacterium RL_2_7]|nr:hypothetical protein [Acaryochloridaceae cyanobacterium RL_2_7]
MITSLGLLIATVAGVVWGIMSLFRFPNPDPRGNDTTREITSKDNRPVVPEDSEISADQFFEVNEDEVLTIYPISFNFKGEITDVSDLAQDETRLDARSIIKNARKDISQE